MQTVTPQALEQTSPEKQKRQQQDVATAKPCKKHSNTKIIAIVAVVVLVVAMISAFLFISSKQDSVAATVNGENIMESQVTVQVSQRFFQLGISTNEEIAQWMVNNDSSPEQVRQEAIDSLAYSIVMKQLVDEYGIEITEEEIQQETQKAIGIFDSEDEFWEYATNMGYTRDSYREHIIDSIAQRKAMESYAEKADENTLNEKKLAMVNDMKESVDESRYVTVLSSTDEETMRKAKDAFDNGKSLEEVSTMEGVEIQYKGWDFMYEQIPSSVEDAKSETLDETETDVFEDGDGKWIFAVISEIVLFPDNGFSDITNVPDFLIPSDNIVSMNEDALQTETNKRVESADIVVFPMPDWVPYNVSLEGMEKNLYSDESNGSASQNEYNQNIDDEVYGEQAEIEGANGEAIVPGEELELEGGEVITDQEKVKEMYEADMAAYEKAEVRRNEIEKRRQIVNDQNSR